MIKSFLYIPFFMLFSCANSEAKSFNNEQLIEIDKHIQQIVKDSIKVDYLLCLNFDFSKNFPNSLKITEKNIYVGNGKLIYRFDFKGNLLNKIALPNSLGGFIDFAPYEVDKTIFYTTWNGTITCFDEKGQIIYNTASGDLVKIDNKGNAYTIYQEYDHETDKITNKLKIIDTKGNYTNYSTNKDLGCLNFEIINNSIMLHASDGRFYILPLDNEFDEKFYNLTEVNEERVWFLGISDNNYLFRTFEFENRQDMISYFDLNLNHIKSQPLSFPFHEIVTEQRKDEFFLMENPTAIMYAVYNNSVYFLRNTKKGSCILLLN